MWYFSRAPTRRLSEAMHTSPTPRLLFSRTLRSFGLLLLCALGFACGGPRTANGPTLPFKKLVRNAEVEARAGNYAAAAASYRAAYDQKPRRGDLAYRAAELYERVRDYKQAAAAYQLLEADEQRWPLLGLRYGRALKQDGRYEQARRQLALFRESYNGADRAIVTEIVNNELAGIRLALNGTTAAGPVDVTRPGRGINTRADEFGPVAVAGDQLFFTSTAGGQSRLYQSRLEAKEWTKAGVPPGFPVIAEGEFGTGAFSADGRAFFFTICSGVAGEDADTRCEIFRGERSAAGAWTQPRALGPTINVADYNNAHPAVSTAPDGRTMLFFASNRPGGRGGLDLYVAVQQDPADPLSFSAPGNLGPVINTVSDEVMPTYDAANRLLYFASNGHPGYGGLDLLRAAGEPGDFAPPENLGAPINSAADDYGLTLSNAGGRAYLASNRTFEDQKSVTTDVDIYAVNFRAARARLKAVVYENTTGEELPGATVQLLELDAAGTARAVDQRRFPTGVYDFDLTPGRRYRVVVTHPSYHSVEYQVATATTGSSLYGQPVFLRRRTDAPAPGLRLPEGEERPRPAPAPAPVPEQQGERVPDGGTARAVDAVAYRIQISAERTFDPAAGRFEAVRSVGELRAEPVPGRNLQRVTVGYFTDATAAKAALTQVQSQGFPSAFAVRYDNGKRFGLVRL